MKPMTPDVALLCDFDSDKTADKLNARNAAKRLLRACSNVERAALIGFATGQRRALGVHLPRWAYQIAGALLLRYPPEAFPNPRARADRVLKVFRARLIIALNIGARGARL